MKNFFIIRGVPGAGKTTIGNILAGKENNIAADDFMLVNGNYCYTVPRIIEAHKQCKAKIKELMQAETPTIAVSNTTVQDKDVQSFRILGKKHGYTVFVVLAENWHNGKSTKAVPKEKLKEMRDNLMESIRP